MNFKLIFLLIGLTPLFSQIEHYIYNETLPPKSITVEAKVPIVFDLNNDYDSIYHIKYKELPPSHSHNKNCEVFQRKLEFSLLSDYSFGQTHENYESLYLEEKSIVVVLTENNLDLYKIDNMELKKIDSKNITISNIEASKLIYSKTSNSLYLIQPNALIRFKDLDLTKESNNLDFKPVKKIIGAEIFEKKIYIISENDGVQIYTEKDENLFYNKKLFENFVIRDVKLYENYLLILEKNNGIHFISTITDEELPNKISFANGKKFAGNNLKTFWTVSDYSNTNSIYEIFYNFDTNTFFINRQLFEINTVKQLVFLEDYIAVVVSDINRIYYHSVPKPAMSNAHDVSTFFFEKNLKKIDKLNKNSNDFLIGFSSSSIFIFKIYELKPHITCYYKNKSEEAYNFNLEFSSKNCKSKTEDFKNASYFSVCTITQKYELNVIDPLFSKFEIDRITMGLIIMICLCCIVTCLIGTWNYFKKNGEIKNIKTEMQSLKIKYQIIDNEKDNPANISQNQN